ncbi:MAG: invasion associated locus B family protein [Bradyrhizobium sp.]|uniref:invasion associated locus B family protein n=1 Tax=Bradyrhizobium sp. TaxID=376 RepID=UPI0025BE6D62|nr:invasion associated locus B family protein [Bradyrhizobium sp.]MBI5260688.1 invasion associated locus B family protein [Bradyrhizobium sp.]
MSRRIARPAKRICLGISICICTMAPQGSLAEGLPPPRPDSPAADVAPRGERAPRPIEYSAWQKLCFTPPSANVVCRTTTTGTWDTRQVAIRVDLIDSPNGDARLQVFMPVGLYLPPGIRLSIDQDVPMTIPYSWCLANACVAATAADAKLINALENGQRLTLEAVDSNILTITTTVPLHQFAAAHRGPPAQRFERQFDND